MHLFWRNLFLIFESAPQLISHLVLLKDLFMETAKQPSSRQAMTHTAFTYHQYRVIHITGTGTGHVHPLSQTRIYLLISNCNALKGMYAGYAMTAHMCRLLPKLAATLAMPALKPQSTTAHPFSVPSAHAKIRSFATTASGGWSPSPLCC
jgi:hypothetical protein